MKYLSMLKNGETPHPDPLQKVQKDLFTVNAVPQGKGLPENESPAQVDFDQEITATIDELGAAHVVVTEAPPEIRRETLRLEEEITEACNKGDAGEFRRALHKWRLSWLRSLH